MFQEGDIVTCVFFPDETFTLAAAGIRHLSLSRGSGFGAQTVLVDFRGHYDKSHTAPILTLVNRPSGALTDVQPTTHAYLRGYWAALLDNGRIVSHGVQHVGLHKEITIQKAFEKECLRLNVRYDAMMEYLKQEGDV